MILTGSCGANLNELKAKLKECNLEETLKSNNLVNRLYFMSNRVSNFVIKQSDISFEWERIINLKIWCHYGIGGDFSIFHE